MRGRALPAPIYTVIGAAAITPALGFARFWRGLARDAAWIRPALGWATAQEVGYPALWQCNEADDSAARCYFTGPADEIISLTRGATAYWNVWQGPVRPLAPPG